ncbi:hypothetical protein PTKIN_Ptkin02bG0256200 [Pterospermum kingtungense]
MKPKKFGCRKKEYSILSNSHDSSVPNHISKEEASVTISVPDIGSPLLPANNFKKTQEAVQNLVAPEVVTDGRKNIEDGLFYTLGEPFTSGSGGSEADPSDFSHLEPSFLMTQAHSDSSQPIAESVDKVHDGNLAAQADQPVTSINLLSKNPQTVIDGLAQFENGANEDATGVNPPASSQGTFSLKACDFELNAKDESKYTGNHGKGHEQPLVWAESPTRATSNVQPAASGGTSEHGDILIDINDRFPHDLLSDIFSKARMSQNFYGGSPFPCYGARLSLNMRIMNLSDGHTSVIWPQDEFVMKDVSLMDQDHLGFTSSLTNIESGAPIDYSYPPLTSAGAVTLGHIKPDINLSENIRQESTTVTDADNLNLGSDYKDRKLDIRNSGLPLVDLSLGDFDITANIFQIVEFWHEADILSKLHHPNVVPFYGVVQDGPRGTLATVTEYMMNGSLRHVLLSKDWQLDRHKRLIIAMDAAFGMEYLHSKNIVHFDLKCDNLLVNLKDLVRPICKVGDFSLSKITRNTMVTGGVRGTLPWMAPELLNGSSKVSAKVR